MVGLHARLRGQLRDSFHRRRGPRWARSATPSRLEIQTAEHDIGCKLRVNVLGVEFAVVSRYQDQAITAHAAAFAQAKKVIAREALGLRRLMATVPASRG